MTSQQLIQMLYQIQAVKFGHFTLKNGKPSLIYLDLRQIISYPTILRAVAEAMWEKINNITFDLMCGVPYTALPIATCLSLDHDIPMIMRRKEKKSYGTQQLLEGKFNPGQTCLIIEDVMTTGSSILETAEDLEKSDLKVKDVVLFIDRQQGGKENLAKKHYQAHAVFTLKNILHTLQALDILTEEERHLINQLIVEYQ